MVYLVVSKLIDGEWYKKEIPFGSIDDLMKYVKEHEDIKSFYVRIRVKN